MEREKIRLGVIGIGNMGSEHCRNLVKGKCPEIELAAVADVREERREWAKRELPESVKVYGSGEELIRDGKCDAVLIAVPHYLHEELTEQALNHGLDVMCEKPIAVEAAAAERMISCAKASGKTLALMFNQRTNGLYRAIHQMMQSGELGAMKRMSWIVTDWYRTQKYYDSGSWRATWAGEGGGVLLNQCPHQLDLLIWLCGMPIKVQAQCHEGKWHHIEVEDDVTVYLEFENGATGVFTASTGDLPGTNRLEIDCEKGKLICEDGKIRCFRLQQNERETCFESDDPWYQCDVKEEEIQTDGENPQHIGVLNAFAAYLLHGNPLTADAEDGLKALQLSNAIHYSGWAGEMVSVPVDEGKFHEMLSTKIAGSTVRKTDDITYESDHSGTGAKR
ncbi:MAG: Gfo/Idh/MocA family oxidoreductase [Clostridia bacterium]|nr:Gfo/Idh/MocA family oxidoreductase [Clostridia bacterium]